MIKIPQGKTRNSYLFVAYLVYLPRLEHPEYRAVVPPYEKDTARAVMYVPVLYTWTKRLNCELLCVRLVDILSIVS